MTTPAPPVLVVHGGAGIISRERVTPDQRQALLQGLGHALVAGHAALTASSSPSSSTRAVDACIAAVVALEDNPLFNAGKGAVYTRDGLHRCEASVTDGLSGRSGACTMLSRVKNPILLADLIRRHAPGTHCFLAGADAEQFALDHHLDLVDPSYFDTSHRYAQHRAGLGLAPTLSEADGAPVPSKGTVGAVAVDALGNLAAATSTGGKTNKWTWRIGDTPLIGAGNYAENGVVACSGTGDGEFFIQTVAAYDVACRIKYGQQGVRDATAASLRRVEDAGGTGGLIAVDAGGRIAMPNTSGMYRGWIDAAGLPHCAIFKDDPDDSSPCSRQ
ncbi:beta-aspartyl-peptidase [Plasmodiophora brassicae]|uniref:beta-aspartyl-peptidase n=1 Tax=Plasmodiophora brassicae TaxID=37360 RepID=A0A0G4IXZ2_PLABS|nr:hypothetical protein PBRA_007932 [Plasmodiophora brassicae]SPQ96467.1 unnamed protein product [Plasmodiophora brassicae]